MHALEVLAVTGMVQLELDPRLAKPLDFDQVHRLIDHFHISHNS